MIAHASSRKLPPPPKGGGGSFLEEAHAHALMIWFLDI